VTIRLPRAVWQTAGLGYGPLPEGEVQVDEAYDAVTFVACGRGEPSGSRAGGPVTFWSGFVLTSKPACIPLLVHADNNPSPERVVLSLGKDPCLD
jgi:hypothetical protein